MEFKYEKRNNDFFCHDSECRGGKLGCHAHLHYHIEMGCLFEGKTRLTVDSKQYDIEAGDLFICFPNQIHEYETLEKEKYLLFIFNPDILPTLSKQFISTLPSNSVIKGALNDDEIKSLMYEISNTHFSEKPHKEIIIQGYLLALFGRLFGLMDRYHVKSQNSKSLGTILQYCAENYEHQLSLSLLEKELHISKYYISHILSNKLHISFNDYINSLRISRACKYLLESELSVTDISEAVGFNTLRTFNRAFTKHLGVTPTQYRISGTPSHFTSLPM